MQCSGSESDQRRPTIFKKGDLSQPKRAFLPINQITWYGKRRLHKSVMAIPDYQKVRHAIKYTTDFVLRHPKREQKDLIITLTNLGPIFQRRDQKGTSFDKKSPKGTIPLLGDTCVYWFAYG